MSRLQGQCFLKVRLHIFIYNYSNTLMSSAKICVTAHMWWITVMHLKSSTWSETPVTHNFTLTWASDQAQRLRSRITHNFTNSVTFSLWVFSLWVLQDPSPTNSLMFSPKQDNKSASKFSGHVLQSVVSARLLSSWCFEPEPQSVHPRVIHGWLDSW